MSDYFDDAAPQPSAAQDRIERMTAHVEGGGEDPLGLDDGLDFDDAADSDYWQSGREDETEGGPGGEEYDQAREDLGALMEGQRLAHAAELGLFERDIKAAAEQHGLPAPTDDELRTLYLEMRNSAEFNPQGVHNFIERVAQEEWTNLKHAVNTGHDPETGELLTARELEDAREQLAEMAIHRGQARRRAA